VAFDVTGRRRFERGGVLARDVEFSHVILRMLGIKFSSGGPVWRSDRGLPPGFRWRFGGVGWFATSLSDASCIPLSERARSRRESAGSGIVTSRALPFR
jgi:hypothetical protein